jgi:hypothetical protein
VRYLSPIPSGAPCQRGPSLLKKPWKPQERSGLASMTTDRERHIPGLKQDFITLVITRSIYLYPSVINLLPSLLVHKNKIRLLIRRRLFGLGVLTLTPNSSTSPSAAFLGLRLLSLSRWGWGVFCAPALGAEEAGDPMMA